jgi:hypothetical protein
MKILLLIVLLTVTVFSLGHACDGCQCRVNTSGEGKFSLNLNFRYVDFSHLYGNSASSVVAMSGYRPWRIDKPGAARQTFHGGSDWLDGSYERYSTANLIVTYRFDARWLVSAILPMTYRHSRTVTAAGVESASTQGLGDAVVWTGYNVYTNARPNYETRFTIMGGVKLPTGSTDARLADGDFVDMHIQTGSGSLDYLFMADASKQMQRWEWIGDFIFRYNKTGTRGFRFGNFINTRIGARFNFLDNKKSLVDIDPVSDRFQLLAGVNLDGEWEGREHAGGMLVDNTGGHTFLVSPNLRFRLNKFMFNVYYQIPFAHQLQGRQLGQTTKIISEMSFYL